MKSSLHDFALAYTSAWCSRDPDRVAAHFAPGGALTINGGVPAVGRAAIAEAARSFMKQIPDLHLEMDGLLIQAHGAVFRWTLTSAVDSLRISGFEEWTFGTDGLIVDSQGHFDSADYQRQLSAIQP